MQHALTWHRAHEVLQLLSGSQHSSNDCLNVASI